ncbi:hypothetical protein E2C01_053900 [Portunus trituberculatus]|uniref:Uncharacterized protein n=1 Tax=Portunus trituberculatus TaxID=210409 RepID=A0A5B7GLK4_PORTR|nr:hypothetical protein [Portunus trituberculatus]
MQENSDDCRSTSHNWRRRNGDAREPLFTTMALLKPGEKPFLGFYHNKVAGPGRLASSRYTTQLICITWRPGQSAGTPACLESVLESSLFLTVKDI